jgi:hypothetical protein
MNKLRIVRLAYVTIVFTYLSCHGVAFVVKGQEFGVTQTLKDHMLQDTIRLEHLSSELNKIQGAIDALNLQQRITSIEVHLTEAKQDIDRLVAWQEKFQWALIVLLAEAVWRVYDQVKSKRG